MGCNLDNVTIDFKSSGVRIRPLSVDIDRSRQERDQFDAVFAEVTAAAGDHIQTNYTKKEPVTISVGSTTLYYGYAQHDCVNHGRTRSTLTISDPRRLLREGIVDKEWNQVNLTNVTRYIYEQIPDPEGVLTGIELSDPELDVTKLQTETMFGLDRTVQGATELTSDIIEWAADLNPLREGDGNFDFREETPYSAMMEVCDIWEVEMFMRHDGTLVVGIPQMESTVHPAGLGDEIWRVVEYNIPENPTPLKGVYVKGGTAVAPAESGDSNVTTYDVTQDLNKLQTRAYAGFTNVSSDETLVGSARDTSDPTSLKDIARRKLINTVSQNNSGNIVIDVLASDVPDSWFEDFKPGGHIALLVAGHDCIDAKDGLYDVHSVQHRLDGSEGWSVTLKVSAAITDAGSIETKFWYFDPTDPSMTEDGGPP